MGATSTPTPLADLVPAQHLLDAEEVRAHLVMLRGGGPFLSPADALRLVDWLDEGVRVPAILTAIERAAEARRKTRSRLPLTLAAASRHLDKPPRTFGWPQKAEGHPMEPAARVLRTLPDPDGSAPALANALVALPTDDPERLMRDALALVRAFLQRTWDALGTDDREEILAEAARELGNLQLPAEDHAVLLEEVGRDRLRLRYDALSAAALWGLVRA